MKTRSVQETLARFAEVAPRCACFNTRKTARALTQLYDEALKPSGLRATQFSLLAATFRTGKITVSQLAQRLVMDRTTLTRDLKPLERRGLIRIEAGEDRRERIVSLTGEGRELLAKTVPLWEKAQGRVLKGLGRSRWNTMLEDLSLTVALTER